MKPIFSDPRHKLLGMLIVSLTTAMIFTVIGPPAPAEAHDFEDSDCAIESCYPDSKTTTCTTGPNGTITQPPADVAVTSTCKPKKTKTATCTQPLPDLVATLTSTRPPRTKTTCPPTETVTSVPTGTVTSPPPTTITVTPTITTTCLPTKTVSVKDKVWDKREIEWEDSEREKDWNKDRDKNGNSNSSSNNNNSYNRGDDENCDNGSDYYEYPGLQYNKYERNYR